MGPRCFGMEDGLDTNAGKIRLVLHRASNSGILSWDIRAMMASPSIFGSMRRLLGREDIAWNTIFRFLFGL